MAPRPATPGHKRKRPSAGRFFFGGASPAGTKPPLRPHQVGRECDAPLHGGRHPRRAPAARHRARVIPDVDDRGPAEHSKISHSKGAGRSARRRAGVGATASGLCPSVHRTLCPEPDLRVQKPTRALMLRSLKEVVARLKPMPDTIIRRAPPVNGGQPATFESEGAHTPGPPGVRRGPKSASG
jgi:hypothetical protein